MPRADIGQRCGAQCREREPQGRDDAEVRVAHHGPKHVGGHSLAERKAAHGGRLQQHPDQPGDCRRGESDPCDTPHSRLKRRRDGACRANSRPRHDNREHQNSGRHCRGGEVNSAHGNEQAVHHGLPKAPQRRYRRSTDADVVQPLRASFRWFLRLACAVRGFLRSVVVTLVVVMVVIVVIGRSRPVTVGRGSRGTGRFPRRHRPLKEWGSRWKHGVSPAGASRRRATLMERA
jgi:hypothetical protein